MYPFQIRDLDRSLDVEAQGKVVTVVFVSLLISFSVMSWILVAIDIRLIRKRQRERDAENQLSPMPEFIPPNATEIKTAVSGDTIPLHVPVSPSIYSSQVHGGNCVIATADLATRFGVSIVLRYHYITTIFSNTS